MRRSRSVSRLAAATLAAFALCLLIASPGFAQSAPSLTDSLRWDPAVRRGVLPNGIRWFVKKNARPEARVSLRLAVPAGSTAEDDDQQGLAHFTEHMNFNGSEHFKDADDLVNYLRSIGLRFGADANAYTSFDETVYMLDVPTDRDSTLRTGLDALSDFAGRASMSDAEIEKERGVVLEEWRLGRGAQERIQRKQFPVLFGGSRYAERLPIGKPDVIRTAPTTRFRDFYRDWYRPDWMAVVAIGDIDPARMEKLIQEHFSDLPGRPDHREVPRFEIPSHDETRISVAGDKEATSSSVGVVCTRVRRPAHTVADARRELVADLFTAMLNARFDEVAHRSGAPFLGAFAGNFQFTSRTGVYIVMAQVKDGGEIQGLESVLQETARVRAHGFLASELERARRDRRAQLERAFAERDKTESPTLARSAVQAFLGGEPDVGIEASTRLAQALMPGITLAEVNAMADSLVSTRNRVVLAEGPEKEGATLPDEETLRAVLEGQASFKPTPWVETAPPAELMARKPAPGKVRSTRSIPELGVTVLTFANGAQAWLKPTDFKADEIQFTAYARGGLSLADSAGFTEPWLSPFIVADNGVGGFKNSELQKLLSGRIASMTPYASPYVHGVRGATRPEDLETALQMLYLGFTRPTEDPDAFAALQQQLQAFLANRANSPDQVFADSASAVNNGGFYLAKVPTAGQVAAASLARALDFYRARFANAADFAFFFAGNFKVDSLAPLLARYVGALPSTGRRAPVASAPGPRYPDGITNVVVRKGIEPKGSVRITFFTHEPIEELAQHRANSAASILNDHLRSTLRELLGGTYSPTVRFGSQAPVPGYTTMSIAFGCDPARADTLVAATLGEVRKLVAEGPSEADVSREQEVQRRELETGMKTNGFWTGSLQSVHMMGWDPLRIAKRRERIDLLTPESLRETFRTYFPAGHYSVIRLVPEAPPQAP